jgi:hypothetical protein
MRLGSILFLIICALTAALRVGSVHAETAPQIFAVENCLGERSSVQISWIGVNPAAAELSLDLSYQANGFRPGTFRNSGALPVGLKSVVWDDLPGGMTYFVRLNQTLDGREEPSPTYFFKTCSESTTVPTGTAKQTSASLSYGADIDCRYQTCLVDSTAAGTIIIQPSVDYCANHPSECPPRYYYEPANGQIMVYPNITPSIYASVTFQNGHFVSSLNTTLGTTLCNDGFLTYGGRSTCSTHGGVASGQR